ncbi:MAG: NAD(P)H-binding protein [Alphaproteobacteria bacterium]|nr:NAD(P)H-binding protein [Alphaproteobacteria bacterium]MCB9694474.1 NAD(P)H-binding protein [Alphaproteobacteria bacterium]
MTTVIAGASGFVGSRLAERLEGAGRPVRLGSRDPERAGRSRAGAWVRLDVEDRASLDAALAGASHLVYLVHGMRHDAADLVAHEEACARRVAEAAAAAGVRRIVYLGAPEPSGPPSEHLRARLATGRVLRAGSVPTTELRAGMVIGAGSESWVIVRDLALRLPAMVLPRWLESRSQPVCIGDVVSALAAALELEGPSEVLDVPGPETLSAREILLRVAAAAGNRPVMIGVPLLSPRLSSHWIRWVTRADVRIARQLVDGLTHDIVAPDDGVWARCPHLTRTPLDVAIRRALDEEPPLPRGAALWERAVRRLGRR